MMGNIIKQFVQNAPGIWDDDEYWFSTAQLFRILLELYEVFRDKGPEVNLATGT